MVLLEGIYSTVIMRDILERENHKGQKRITDPVLLKKLRRGYDVSIGKIDNSEGILSQRILTTKCMLKSQKP